MKIFRGGWWVVIAFAAVGIARSASAIYLDEDQHISLRARLYSQAAIRTEGSYDNTIPTVQVGQVVQHRNFFNPELDAKLASYTTWMRDQRGFLPLIAPDGLDFRLAAWGFYDGLYDYGTQQFDQQRKTYKTVYTEATSLVELLRGGDERTNPRDVYGHEQRINELYLSYTKGPLFVRFGKQAISWGESDTVAILDQNNPFDIAHGPPGIFQDLDESRIPLWTLRTSYSLFDTLGPLSSGFIEGYWVPGDLDNTTAALPLITLSPYAPPGPEPAVQAGGALVNLPGGGLNPFKCGSTNTADHAICVALMDHVPSHSMGNSRWGVRTQAVVARDYTVSAWMYTTFPNTGVPRIVGRSTSSTLPAGQNNLFIIEFVHQLVPVIGVSNTFFFEPLNGVIRMEAEYFNREPGFIPRQNLLIDNAAAQTALLTKCAPKPGSLKDCIPAGGSVPHADYIRWELGYDRFFFLRALNPTNSFTWVTAMVGSWNLNEGPREKDFRQYGQQKPGTYPVQLSPTKFGGTLQPTTDDFVQLQRVDMFFQSHLQTDYMHGRLSPSATVIFNTVGTWALPVQLTYRWSDSLLFDLYYTQIGGMFSGLGFYRDRDQVAFRATYQLN